MIFPQKVFLQPSTILSHELPELNVVSGYFKGLSHVHVSPYTYIKFQHPQLILASSTLYESFDDSPPFVFNSSHCIYPEILYRAGGHSVGIY